MKKKSLVATIAAVACIAAVGIGSTFAYFTDKTEVLNNVFTMGNVDITLEEPNWKADDAKKVLPGQTIAKDPTVALVKDSADAYVVVKVTVPQVGGEDLFSFTANEAFTEVEVKGAAAGVYYYGIKLDAQTTSATLFENVKVANITEAQAKDLGEQSIDVVAYAIQTLGFDNVADAYAAYVAQNAQVNPVAPEVQ